MNEALGRMINEAYQKGVIPQNYGPAIDIPVYIAQKKFELGEMIYDCFVEAVPTGLEAKRVTKFEEAKEKNEMDEVQLLENMADRPRAMVEMYFGLGEQRRHTLEEIATRSGVTRERVRQIINKALAPKQAEYEENEASFEDEADTHDYILDEENRLKSETERVIDISARIYGVTVQELYEHTRRAPVVIPRQIAMYLLRTEVGLSYPSIGKQFDRDHTTVIYACNKVKEMLTKNKRLNSRVEKIKQLLATQASLTANP